MNKEFDDNIIIQKIMDWEAMEITYEYDDLNQLEKNFKNRKVKLEDIVYIGNDDSFNDLKDAILRFEFNINFSLLLLKSITFDEEKDSNVKRKFFTEFCSYIKLATIRKIISENLKLIKDEKQLMDGHNYYKNFKSIIDEVNSISKKINYSYKKGLIELIEDYELEFKYLVTRFDLAYGMFNIIMSDPNKKLTGGKEIELVRDLKELRLNNDFRNYGKLRSSYDIEKKINELEDKINVYFRVEDALKNLGINKDFNQYLILRSFKRIEILYLSSYENKPTINVYKKIMKNIDRKYYDFFLKKDVINLIGENQNISEINTLVEESVKVLSKGLKDIFIKRSNINEKMNLLNELMLYTLEDFNLSTFECIPREFSNINEVKSNNIDKIKHYIIE